MLRIQYIFVGKLKSPYWQSAATHYDTRIKRWYKCRETIVKDGTGKDPAERMAREGQAILNKITPRDYVVCLDEHGRTMTSPELARTLQTWFEHPVKAPCFIIGGAYGLDQRVRDRADTLLSLGPMTFPHELARVILCEQLYRAGTLLKNIPYHHA
jgi:23S rRNA (pseudouridine1915-N3)-methyltransferase